MHHVLLRMDLTNMEVDLVAAQMKESVKIVPCRMGTHSLGDALIFGQEV